MSTRTQHGSLRKRKSGRAMVWLGLWWENGHRRAKTLGKLTGMTKTEAQEALDKLVRPINEERGTVEYTLENYTRHVVFPWYERKWKPSSTKQTTEDRICHHILKALGDRPLSSITRAILQDFLDKKAKERPQRGKEGDVLSHSTVMHLRWDLKQILRMAVNDGLLSRNPADLLHTPRGTVKETRVLTLSQAQLLISALGLRERLIVKLAGICGMRPGELIGLKWHNVKETTVTVERRIYRGQADTPKTAHGVRTVALPKSVINDINEWRLIAPNTATEAWVFPSENDKTPLWANNVWYDKIRPTLETLGLAWVNYQVLRRSAVTMLNATGDADATVVAAICGHGVDVSLNTYNKVGIERQRAAIQKLDNALQVNEHAA